MDVLHGRSRKHWKMGELERYDTVNQRMSAGDVDEETM